MALDSKHFIYSHERSRLCFGLNIDAISEKYKEEEEVEHDEVVDVSILQAVKHKSHTRLRKCKPFGSSRLPATLLRDDKLPQSDKLSHGAQPKTHRSQKRNIQNSFESRSSKGSDSHLDADQGEEDGEFLCLNDVSRCVVDCIGGGEQEPSDAETLSSHSSDSEDTQLSDLDDSNDDTADSGSSAGSVEEIADRLDGTDSCDSGDDGDSQQRWEVEGDEREKIISQKSHRTQKNDIQSQDPPVKCLISEVNDETYTIENDSYVQLSSDSERQFPIRTRAEEPRYSDKRSGSHRHSSDKGDWRSATEFRHKQKPVQRMSGDMNGDHQRNLGMSNGSETAGRKSSAQYRGPTNDLMLSPPRRLAPRERQLQPSGKSPGKGLDCKSSSTTEAKRISLSNTDRDRLRDREKYLVPQPSASYTGLSERKYGDSVDDGRQPSTQYSGSRTAGKPPAVFSSVQHGLVRKSFSERNTAGEREKAMNSKARLVKHSRSGVPRQRFHSGDTADRSPGEAGLVAYPDTNERQVGDWAADVGKCLPRHQRQDFFDNHVVENDEKIQSLYRQQFRNREHVDRSCLVRPGSKTHMNDQPIRTLLSSPPQLRYTDDAHSSLKDSGIDTYSSEEQFSCESADTAVQGRKQVLSVANLDSFNHSFSECKSLLSNTLDQSDLNDSDLSESRLKVCQWLQTVSSNDSDEDISKKGPKRVLTNQKGGPQPPPVAFTHGSPNQSPSSTRGNTEVSVRQLGRKAPTGYHSNTVQSPRKMPSERFQDKGVRVLSPRHSPKSLLASNSRQICKEKNVVVHKLLRNLRNTDIHKGFLSQDLDLVRHVTILPNQKARVPVSHAYSPGGNSEVEHCSVGTETSCTDIEMEEETLYQTPPKGKLFKVSEKQGYSTQECILTNQPKHRDRTQVSKSAQPLSTRFSSRIDAGEQNSPHSPYLQNQSPSARMSSRQGHQQPFYVSPSHLHLRRTQPVSPSTSMSRLTLGTPEHGRRPLHLVSSPARSPGLRTTSPGVDFTRQGHASPARLLAGRPESPHQQLLSTGSLQSDEETYRLSRREERYESSDLSPSNRQTHGNFTSRQTFKEQFDSLKKVASSSSVRSQMWQGTSENPVNPYRSSSNSSCTAAGPGPYRRMEENKVHVGSNVNVQVKDHFSDQRTDKDVYAIEECNRKMPKENQVKKSKKSLFSGNINTDNPRERGVRPITDGRSIPDSVNSCDVFKVPTCVAVSKPSPRQQNLRQVTSRKTITGPDAQSQITKTKTDAFRGLNRPQINSGLSFAQSTPIRPGLKPNLNDTFSTIHGSEWQEEDCEDEIMLISPNDKDD